MAEETKVCTKCGEGKPLSEFNKCSQKKSRLKNECRDCSKARMRAWRESDRGKALEAAYRENPEKQAMMAAHNQKPETKALKKRNHKIWRDRPENKSRLNEQSKEINRGPSAKQARAIRRMQRYREDPLYHCEVAVRSMLSRVLNAANENKSGRTYDMLGYTADQFRQRIECQFLPGMSWANRGFTTWHIDHKKPVAEFIRQGITDPRIINMLCNLRPMWAADNAAKRDSWIPLVAANDNVKQAKAA